MTEHFSHVHWGFADGGEFVKNPTEEPRVLGQSSGCPVRPYFSPEAIAALKRAMNREA